jgi:hypothetical protein
MNAKIDYDKIAAAIFWYKALGYKYIEAPWLVSNDSMMVTAPPDRRLFSTFAGNLVASGEQSFIEIRKSLKPGHYLCATPCFRDEPILDEWHLQSFFKVELIEVEPILVEESINSMIGDAAAFFSRWVNAERKRTNIGYDLEYNGIELGSYGYREHEDFKWVYGTGCAEPRLSQVVGKEISNW